MDPEEGQDTGNEIDSQGAEDSAVANSAVAEPEGTGINPAWNELLEVVPSQLHSLVTPHLTKWDQNYQNSLQQVHSQYAPYKPFVENQVAPDQIEYAMSVMQAIENNPREVLQALQAYIGEDDEQGQEEQVVGDSETPEWMQHPEWQKTQQMVQTMAQLLVQQREEEARTQADQEVAQELSDAREKHGEFDEEWVLTKLMNNPKMKLEDAVIAYHQFEQGVLSKARQPGPKVLGAGGSTPNQELNPKNLGDKERRNLVANLLQQSASQNH